MRAMMSSELRVTFMIALMDSCLWTLTCFVQVVAQAVDYPYPAERLAIAK